MTGVEEAEARPAAGPRAWWFGVAVALVTLPILAHGCHRGDHDDEPAVAPADRRVPDAIPPA
jgi:hypothetical protein